MFFDLVVRALLDLSFGIRKWLIFLFSIFVFGFASWKWLGEKFDIFYLFSRFCLVIWACIWFESGYERKVNFFWILLDFFFGFFPVIILMPEKIKPCLELELRLEANELVESVMGWSNRVEGRWKFVLGEMFVRLILIWFICLFWF